MINNKIMNSNLKLINLILTKKISNYSYIIFKINKIQMSKNQIYIMIIHKKFNNNLIILKIMVKIIQIINKMIIKIFLKIRIHSKII